MIKCLLGRDNRMRTDCRDKQFRSSGQCAAAGVIFLASLSVQMTGRAQESVPAETGTMQTNGHVRKATLEETYGMFFHFVSHIDARSNEDEKQGIDRTFYRHQVQKASALTPEEYGHVLVSAKRFTKKDDDIQKRITELNDLFRTDGGPPPTPSEAENADYRARMAALYAERDTALTRAIANLRQALGAERAHVFEAYLQNDFPSPVPKPARPKKRRSKEQSKEQSESTPSQ